MHELSVARALLQTACRHLPPAPSAVHALHVTIGSATGIIPDALALAFDAVAAGTRLAGVRLVIDRTAARSRCAACDIEFSFEDVLGHCPQCNRLAGELLAGEEILLRSVEVIDV